MKYTEEFIQQALKQELEDLAKALNLKVNILPHKKLTNSFSKAFYITFTSDNMPLFFKENNLSDNERYKFMAYSSRRSKYPVTYFDVERSSAFRCSISKAMELFASKKEGGIVDRLISAERKLEDE